MYCRIQKPPITEFSSLYTISLQPQARLCSTKTFFNKKYGRNSYYWFHIETQDWYMWILMMTFKCRVWVIMQLKLGISHLTYKGRVVRTNMLECFYGKMPNNKCNLRGQEQEDNFHIMFNCPHYKEIRNKYLSLSVEDFSRYNRSNYLTYFSNLGNTELSKIFHFFAERFMYEVYI